ncbi:MAG TPA: SUMF1/EgtB/PvdO family nonheme iron enzyme [Candidatus Cloacimonadota bacterium]|nr:SUMF1/EgtB/PvdO family nonheme iron enzyme [Candidatus Cloacimonadota bacterium]
MKVALIIALIAVAALVSSCWKMDNPLDPNNWSPVQMVLIPGGNFVMGDTWGEGDPNELPTQSVTLNSFYMGKYEVTQGEWQVVMGTNPASKNAKRVNYPVCNVSWYAVLEYCNLRSIAEGLTPVYSISGSTNPADWGNVPVISTSITWDATICNWSANGYRLPTEAEWEYAARGASNTPDYIYSGSDDINAVAWNSVNSGGTSHPVGTKAPNGLGLYDMSGNLYEWCWDWYGSYSISPSSIPTGPAIGSHRVGRGGYWYNSAYYCRVANRNEFSPNRSDNFLGFRLCRAGSQL